MPSMPMSSMRPMKGEMKVAPALAASSAWLAEKHSVTLTMRPVRADRLAGLQPVQRQRHLDADIVGDLGEHLGLACIISEYSVAATSAETGPLTMLADLACVTSAILPPDFRISEGWW